jgi:hypothetical protein
MQYQNIYESIEKLVPICRQKNNIKYGIICFVSLDIALSFSV